MDALVTPQRFQHRFGAWVASAIVTLMAAAAAAAEPAQPAFKPGEISIGEPIALPFGGPGSGTAAPAAAASAATGELQPTGSVPGSGWLGLTVAESTVPGRWRVESVTADGPAARAGITAGDELRAVNGLPLASAEEVSQALTAIAAGQDVRVAVARADQVSDVVLRAESRPSPRVTEPSRFAAAPQTAPVPLESPTPAATLARTSAPPVTAPAAEPAGAPAGGVQWQPGPTREPAPATGSRFGEPATAPPPMVPPPSVAGVPPATSPTPSSPPGRIALGVRTVPIDPATQARFHLRDASGAYVIGVVEDLPAARAGVPPGSVIVGLGGEPVRSPVDLTRLVTSGPLDKPVTLQFVLPGGEAKQAAVVLRSLDVPLERALTGDRTEAVPPAALQSAPLSRRSERPADDEGVIRAEIRALRSRLERLESLLDPGFRRSR